MDRYLALKSARYVFTTARHLGDLRSNGSPGGIVENRAREVLEERPRAPHRGAARGRSGDAIAHGAFADVEAHAHRRQRLARASSRATRSTLNPILEVLEA